MSNITLAHRLDCCSGCKYLICTYMGEYEEFDKYICAIGYTPKNHYGVYECEHGEDSE